jgi:hypothetical protein
MRRALLCGMLGSASSNRDMQREGEGAVVRQGHLIAVVGILLIGCTVLLVVGCAGVRSGTPQEEEQGHTEATNKEQTRSPDATASEEARCEGTRTIKIPVLVTEAVFTTNDLPGCPNKGGLLSGTDKEDNLAGKDGDDEIRGLGASDYLVAGPGNDVLYGGPGKDNLEDAFDAGDDDVFYGGDGDDLLGAGNGEDVLYGGDGSDAISAGAGGEDRQPDKLYCGKGSKDEYSADKNDYVSSSCEKKMVVGAAG